MNTQKLKEALVELKHQRTLLDGAIKNIEGVLDALRNGTEAPTSQRKSSAMSYIDYGESILEQAGKPMHIEEIAKKISEATGKETPRASVESSFSRHIKNFGPKARVVKIRPAHYGLPIWRTLFHKEQQSAA